MKIIALMCLMPLAVKAQLACNIYGGATFHETARFFELAHKKGVRLSSVYFPGYSAGIKIMADRSGGNAGIAFDLHQLREKNTYKNLGATNPDITSYTIDRKLGDPLKTAYLFFNIKIRPRRSFGTLGIMGGAAFTQHEDVISYGDSTQTFSVAKMGFITGVNAGYSYSISQNFGLTAEVGFRILSMRHSEKLSRLFPKPYDVSYRLFYFPCMVGLVYRFFNS